MKDDTTTCAGMRDALLDADPAELRGAGDSPVALHVRDCGACAVLAGRILAGQQELANALSKLTRTAAAPADPTGHAAAGGALPLPPGGRGNSRQGRAGAPDTRPISSARSRRRLLAAGAPLAAAAILVLFIVQRRAGNELQLLEPLPASTAHEANMPVVNVAGSGDVAVMQTTNPDITVIWYLNRERQ